MGRPPVQNPKNRHIGIVTTDEKFQRFKKLGLVGDEVIDVLLYYLENDKTKLNVQKQQIISNIKNIQKEIENLEFERLKEETRLEEINQEIGVNKDNGLRNDVDKALKRVFRRFENQSIFNIYEFVEDNKTLIENQAYLCNTDVEEFKKLIYEFS